MVFHSPHPDLNVPPYRSLPDFLLEHPSYSHAEPKSSLGRTLRQPILYSSPSDKSSRTDAAPLSLIDLRTRARSFAASLLLPTPPPPRRPASNSARTAWKRGDVLLLFATSQHDYAAAVLGCQLAGGTAALANPSYKPHELAHQLRLVGGPKAILTLAASLDTVQKAVELALNEEEQGFEKLQAVPDVWVFEEEHDQSWFKHVLEPGQALLADKRGEALKALDAVEIDPNQDTAVLCFSSGTSGLPKAVRLSHTNMISNLIQATFLLADRLNEPLFDDGNWYHHATTNSAAITPNVKTPARKGSAVVDATSANDMAGGSSSSSSAAPEQGVPRSGSVSGGLSMSQLPGAGKDAAVHQVNVIAKALKKLPFLKAKSQKVVKGAEFHIDILPQFHCYGLLVSLIALHTATPRIVLHRFEPEVFLQAVQDRHVTFAFVVPPILLMLAKSPIVDSYDIQSLRRVASGAASLSQELVAAVRKRTGIVVTDGYGMSEMSPIISLQTLADLDAAPGTVGVLAPCTKARVISPDGKDLGPNQEGELVLSGPQMMQGYLKNDEANKAAFWEAEDEHGVASRWLRTGDVVRIDEMGYITITDRLKDVIKANGFQVSPAELESILFQDPRVGDVAVLGVKDPSDGSEKPWAFIVPAAPSSNPSSPKQEKDKEVVAASAQQGSELEDEEARTKAVMERFNGKVAGYKKLKGITWIEKLPKSDSGKILKRELRDLVDLSKDKQ
ncbi:hypothetical protein OC835_001032 [Tilletia horrida]|nr:hypothetical protein OC835_001032 [Tilletia horrida]